MTNNIGALQKRLKMAEKNDQTAGNSDNSNALFSLDEYFRGACLTQSASTRSPELSHDNHDFLSFLATLQNLHIDILPITWQPALESVGEGGTADVRETRVDRDTSFAFKRVKATRQSQVEEQQIYRALESEIRILAQPQIRSHPNIVKLEGVAWDVNEITRKVWPTLVFETTPLRDVKNFVQTATGKHISIVERLQICAQVAQAVALVHGCHVVHGDIKPENILVFQADAGFNAQVADFGYSTLLAGDDLIYMPRSLPWAAPEWHHRGFRFPQAQKMDAYSFAMFCLWFLSLCFEDESVQQFSSRLQGVGGAGMQLAQKLLEKVAAAEAQMQERLSTFFSLTLLPSPEDRCSDFAALSLLLSRNNQHAPNVSSEAASLQESVGGFQLDRSIHQLARCHIYVRQYMSQCLKRRLEDRKEISNSSINAALAESLEICHWLGFGLTATDQDVVPLDFRGPYYSESRMQELKNSILTDGVPGGYREGYYRKTMLTGNISRQTASRLYPNRSSYSSFASQLRDELSIMEPLLTSYHLLVFELKSQLASILMDAELFSEAGAVNEQIAAAAESLFGKDNPIYWSCLGDLVTVYTAQDRHEKALELCSVVLQERIRHFGPKHASVFTSQRALADAYSRMGRHEESVTMLHNLIDTQRKVLGDENDSVADSLSVLARAYAVQGKFGKAVEIELQALLVNEHIHGQRHPSTVYTMAAIADWYINRGDTDQAEEWATKAKSLADDLLPDDSLGFLLILEILAVVAMRNGHFANAEKFQSQVIETREKVHGSEHSRTLSAKKVMIFICDASGKFDEAEIRAVEVVKASERIFGNDDSNTLKHKRTLAGIYGRLGKYDLAEKLGLSIISDMKRTLGETALETIGTTANQATLCLKLGKPREAEEMAQSAITGYKALEQGRSSELLNAQNTLAMAYKAQDRYPEAETLFRSTLEEWSLLNRFGSQEMTTCMNNLVNLCMDLRRWEEAKSEGERALQSAESTLAFEHPLTLKSVENLATIYKQLGDFVSARNLEERVVAVHRQKDQASELRGLPALSAAFDLAITYFGLGMHDTSIKLMDEIVAGSWESLGETHGFYKQVKQAVEGMRFKHSECQGDGTEIDCCAKFDVNG